MYFSILADGPLLLDLLHGLLLGHFEALALHLAHNLLGLLVLELVQLVVLLGLAPGLLLLPLLFLLHDYLVPDDLFHHLS